MDLITYSDTAFIKLKHALVHDPVLAMLNFDANFVVEINASDIEVGSVLMQHDKPVVITSKALNSV